MWPGTPQRPPPATQWWGVGDPSWDRAALLVASREEDLAALYPFYSYAARVRRQGHEPEVESPEKGLDE